MSVVISTIKGVLWSKIIILLQVREVLMTVWKHFLAMFLTAESFHLTFALIYSSDFVSTT
jgi:hypothetical protein